MNNKWKDLKWNELRNWWRREMILSSDDQWEKNPSKINETNEFSGIERFSLPLEKVILRVKDEEKRNVNNCEHH